jgi:cytochrome c5
MTKSLMTMLLSLVVAGCSDQSPPAERTSAVEAVSAPAAAPDADVMGKWARSCALCHVDGTGGAPRVGNTKEWKARVAQGDDVLLTHAIEGFQNMPPLGYCMACTREDLAALIRFMSAAPRTSPGDAS